MECGKLWNDRKPGREFCCSSCRLTFNNRRMKRGAELYDLFRAMRRERDQAKLLGLWSEMCRLELQYQIEDEAQRPGRRSYMPPKKALANLFDKGSLPRGDVLTTNAAGLRRR
ncbi:transcriptional regulator [Mesorhizobium waimense]|uniref:transcriptional regulator n=1 Tax=Mesorhizobium waimense TaxID=1300307 RepID=UPI0011C38A78|nr:transcriptional regulator [Mesorhizobium waimense]